MATEYRQLPSLEAGFGIELNLLIPYGGDWSQMYTYYNHGLEPPYGGVRSSATPGDAEWEVDQFDNILRYTNKWIGYISAITGNPIIHNPDLPLSYNLGVVDGGVVMNVEMETLNSEFSWNSPGGGQAPGTVIFKARPAYDLSWEGFLFYVKAMQDFASKIKEQ